MHILPFLLKHLKDCRTKEIPQHAERILVCINAINKEAFIRALTARIAELSESQKKAVLKLLKKLQT